MVPIVEQSNDAAVKNDDVGSGGIRNGRKYRTRTPKLPLAVDIPIRIQPYSEYRQQEIR